MSDSILPPVFTPMLASSATRPFDSDEFLFDVKWDGVRILAFCEPGRTRLFSRTRRDVTRQYPEFVDLHEQLVVTNAVIDCEIVAPEEEGRPSFQRLQQRLGLTRASDVRRAMADVAVQMVCFDLVFVDGNWISEQALTERLGHLREALEFGGRVMRSDPIPTQGTDFFEAARSRDLEGIVAKRKTSPYLPGRRSRDWIKIKVVHTMDCVIGGYSPGMGGRTPSFGSLLVGVYGDSGKLQYLGSVGTGFTDKTLRMLREALDSIETSECPFEESSLVAPNTPRWVKNPLPGARWVSPKLVCEVEYRELTNDLRLRAASFKRLRTDMAPEECRLVH